MQGGVKENERWVDGVCHTHQQTHVCLTLTHTLEKLEKHSPIRTLNTQKTTTNT